jgi:hypothetical protein
MDAATILDGLVGAWRALDSTAAGIALVLLAGILAAFGATASWKLRLYGAMIGGMVVNAVAKAEGAGYEAALAAMVVATAMGFMLGGLGRLVYLKLVKRP